MGLWSKGMTLPWRGRSSGSSPDRSTYGGRFAALSYWMLTFIDTSGRKRRGELVVCKHCGKKFASRIDQPRQYCGKECRVAARITGLNVVCGWCQNEFRKRKSSLERSQSGMVFCTRACKDKAQCLGGITEIMPTHYGTSKAKRNSDYYRRLYKRESKVAKMNCNRCGYDEFECGIDIHHRDGDCRNNELVNLLPLCSPCHRALHCKMWEIK